MQSFMVRKTTTITSYATTMFEHIERRKTDVLKKSSREEQLLPVLMLVTRYCSNARS